MKLLTIDGVEPGQRLPALSFHVTASRLIAGAFASRDYSRLHHDRDYAVEVAGQRDIFANTQFQAALFERYLNDWSGPLGRIARMTFRMTSSVFAGDHVSLTGTVDRVARSGPCAPAVSILIAMAVDDRAATSCEILYALPAAAGDNPWRRRSGLWLQPA